MISDVLVGGSESYLCAPFGVRETVRNSVIVITTGTQKQLALLNALAIHAVPFYSRWSTRTRPLQPS